MTDAIVKMAIDDAARGDVDALEELKEHFPHLGEVFDRAALPLQAAQDAMEQLAETERALSDIRRENQKLVARLAKYER